MRQAKSLSYQIRRNQMHIFGKLDFPTGPFASDATGIWGI